MSTKAPLPSPKQIAETINLMAECVDSPLKFVMAAFPWGEAGGPLEGHTGPKKWQEDELLKIEKFILQNKLRMARGESPKIYQSATCSGRGIGKSTLVSWIALWHLSTKFGAPCIISANTHDQLTKTTFAEIGKWCTMSVNDFWFERNQLEIKPAAWLVDELKKKTRIDSQYFNISGKLWDGDNPNSYVGPHSDIGMLLMFDEASGIPKSIWSAAEMFLTSDKTPYQFWFVFSNPREPDGAFFDCFNKYQDQWNLRQVDARDVEGINLTKHLEKVKTYGEDSDEARVEVRGIFPRQGEKQFISRAVVNDAVERVLDKFDSDNFAPLIMGCDIARYGDDYTVFRFRRGRDARSIPAVELKGLNVVQAAEELAKMIDRFSPDCVNIDEGGAGAGVVDILKDRGYKVNGAMFGGASLEHRWANHGTEMWGDLRDWLPGAMIDNNEKLITDLCAREYDHVGPESKIQLESKDKMKKRKAKSPDHADALALTFHIKVNRLDKPTSRNKKAKRYRPERASVFD